MAERLCESLKIRQAIRLLESALVSVPTVVGAFRPVVLLPASALVGLSPAQLESLLAHELAHIRRHDYLVNMLQSVVETLLFYHPAVWWISERMRAEREKCCDDVAVSLVGGRPLYAQALLDMAKLRNRERELAVAASGSDLRSRIQRVMGLASDGPSRFAPWWAGAAVLSVLLIGLSLLSAERAGQTAQASQSEPQILKDSGQQDPDPPPRAEIDVEEAAFRRFDPFDGKLALDWTVVRPDPTHISLTKNPGKLTITTQIGSVYEVVRPSSRAVPAKNIYLIANPASGDDGFVVTTCIESFHPTVPYQQAALVVYDDDDNYLKWDLERALGSPALVLIRETNQVAVNEYYRPPDSSERDRLWLRLTKRGRLYEYAFSTNGEDFTVVEEEAWGNGSPQWIGILAKNDEAPEEIDAVFGSFEVRSLTAQEGPDDSYTDREKLQGTWEVASLRRAGKLLDVFSFARVVFDRRTLTIAEGPTSNRTVYALDVTKEPRVMQLRSFPTPSSGPVQAAYRVEDDELLICFDSQSGAAAPDRLTTEEGDSLLLLTLARMPAAELAVLDRNARPRDRLFAGLDENDDQLLTIEEFRAGSSTPETIQRATDLFQARDRDGDGELSWDEFSSRPAEAWFAKLDANDDGRLSLDEFAAGNAALARINRHNAAFTEMDRDGNRSLSREEFASRSEEAIFIMKDLDGDGKLTLEQYASWKHWKSPSAAPEEFARRDANGDRLLDFKETSYRRADSKFWEADRDGDYRLSLDEFKTVRPTDAPGQIDAIFKSVDRNRDERISLAEFKGQPRSG